MSIRHSSKVGATSSFLYRGCSKKQHLQAMPPYIESDGFHIWRRLLGRALRPRLHNKNMFCDYVTTRQMYLRFRHDKNFRMALPHCGSHRAPACAIRCIVVSLIGFTSLRSRRMRATQNRQKIRITLSCGKLIIMLLPFVLRNAGTQMICEQTSRHAILISLFSICREAKIKNTLFLVFEAEELFCQGKTTFV